jgi:hypothetical protein
MLAFFSGYRLICYPPRFASRNTSIKNNQGATLGSTLPMSYVFSLLLRSHKKYPGT